MNGPTSFDRPTRRVRDRELRLGAEADFSDTAIVENVEMARQVLTGATSRLYLGVSRELFEADVRRAAGLLDMALVGLDQSYGGEA